MCIFVACVVTFECIEKSATVLFIKGSPFPAGESVLFHIAAFFLYKYESLFVLFFTQQLLVSSLGELNAPFLQQRASMHGNLGLEFKKRKWRTGECEARVSLYLSTTHNPLPEVTASASLLGRPATFI